MNEKLKDRIIPQHIAIIMDGNGRWAKKQNKERFFGHQQGAETLKKISIYASEIGVKYMTVYAFSKENWGRPIEEINSLMSLLITGVNEHLEEINKYQIVLKIIGDKKTLPNDVFQAIEKAEKSTSDNKGMILQIALNYSGRYEIVNATQLIAQQVKENKILIEEITEELFSKNLYTNNTPDPDLLIRTSGEYRISNFLLWQLSYSEIYITDIFWPDFDENCLDQAIINFNNRQRRFGKTSEQLKK